MGLIQATKNYPSWGGGLSKMKLGLKYVEKINPISVVNFDTLIPSKERSPVPK
jgi:hypothetical protein